MRRLIVLLLPLLLAACGSGFMPTLFPGNPANLQGRPAYVVFFTEHSSELDPTAQQVVDAAASVARAYPSAVVHVLGFADPDGGRHYNKALSDARAQAVVIQLENRGINADRVRTEARGPVPFESFPLESRRVEIRVSAN